MTFVIRGGAAALYPASASGRPLAARERTEEQGSGDDVDSGTEIADRSERRGRARARGWLRAQPRRVPAVRPLRTALRTLHLISFGALYGGHLYGAETAELTPALAATVATGGAFVLLEVYRAPIWLVQVRGVATFGKLALVFWMLATADRRLELVLLTLSAAIGAVSSHMPGRWRYHSLLHGRVVGPQEKG